MYRLTVMRSTLRPSRHARSAISTVLVLAWSIAAHGQSLVFNTAIGNPGDTVAVTVTLDTTGVSPGVAGAQNNLNYDASKIAIRANQVCLFDTTVSCLNDGDCISATGISGDRCFALPDCTVNPSIKKEATQFAFLPSGCEGAACTGVHTLVFSFASPNRLIPNGSVLYSCRMGITPDAPFGSYPVMFSGVALSFPNPPGGLVCGGSSAQPCNAEDGVVMVGNAPPTPTSTPSATPTETVTVTPTPTRAPCAGACAVADRVTIDDVLTLVNVALGNAPVAACMAGDVDHDGRISITEILAAANNALAGCP
jgi:hypothetical protein